MYRHRNLSLTDWNHSHTRFSPLHYLIPSLLYFLFPPVVGSVILDIAAISRSLPSPLWVFSKPYRTFPPLSHTSVVSITLAPIHRPSAPRHTASSYSVASSSTAAAYCKPLGIYTCPQHTRILPLVDVLWQTFVPPYLIPTHRLSIVSSISFATITLPYIILDRMRGILTRRTNVLVFIHFRHHVKRGTWLHLRVLLQLTSGVN